MTNRPETGRPETGRPGLLGRAAGRWRSRRRDVVSDPDKGPKAEPVLSGGVARWRPGDSVLVVFDEEDPRDRDSLHTALASAARLTDLPMPAAADPEAGPTTVDAALTADAAITCVAALGRRSRQAVRGALLDRRDIVGLSEVDHVIRFVRDGVRVGLRGADRQRVQHQFSALSQLEALPLTESFDVLLLGAAATPWAGSLATELRRSAPRLRVLAVSFDTLDTAADLHLTGADTRFPDVWGAAELFSRAGRIIADEVALAAPVASLFDPALVACLSTSTTPGAPEPTVIGTLHAEAASADVPWYPLIIPLGLRQPVSAGVGHGIHIARPEGTPLPPGDVDLESVDHAARLGVAAQSNAVFVHDPAAPLGLAGLVAISQGALHVRRSDPHNAERTAAAVPLPRSLPLDESCATGPDRTALIEANGGLLEANRDYVRRWHHGGPTVERLTAAIGAR